MLTLRLQMGRPLLQRDLQPSTRDGSLPKRHCSFQQHEHGRCGRAVPIFRRCAVGLGSQLFERVAGAESAGLYKEPEGGVGGLHDAGVEYVSCG